MMMMMSPRTVGLITLYLVMNVLNVCTPAENHDQPSAVLMLLRRFWPFMNPVRPIAEPMPAIKYFHTSPRYNSRFLYAKKRRYPEELKPEPHISRGDFVIYPPLAPTVSKNEFPYPVEVYPVLLGHHNLNQNPYLRQRNVNHHSAGFLHNSGAKRHNNPRRMWGNTMSDAHSTKYEEIDLPENKILDKLKKYNPLSKLSRRIDFLPWKSPVHQNNSDLSNKGPRKLPPSQNNKNHPHFQKPQPPFKSLNGNEKTVPHSRDAVGARSMDKPAKHSNLFHSSHIPAINDSSEEVYFKNLQNTVKNTTNATSSEELNPVYSHLRWNSTCVSIRNVCLLLFSRDNDGNHCLSIDAKINITDQFNSILNHILKDFGKPCNKTELATGNWSKTAFGVLPITESVPQNVNTSVLYISEKSTPKRAKPYANFSNIQRKSRMLKEIEEDFTTSAEQSLETSTSYTLQNETTYQDVETVSFSPNNTASPIDRRNGDYVAYVTATPHAGLNISSKAETATIQYSMSLLPKYTPPIERRKGIIPLITTKPNPSTFSTTEIDQIDDSGTSALDSSEEVSPIPTSDHDEIISSESTDDLFESNTSRILSLRTEEHQRQGKMTEIHGARGKSVERSMNVYGRKFRTEDYDSEMIDSATSRNVAVFAPEFKPGSLSNFSITLRRQPIKHMSISDVDRTTKTASDVKPRRYFYNVRKVSFSDPTTDSPNVTEDVRVIGSTFFPNRVQKGSLHFGKKNMNSTARDSTKGDTDQRNSFQDEDDADEGEIDAQETGFTMEKLAYVLIGTCCCLSIICLLAVVAAIKCRRILVERRLRSRLFRHNLYHSASAPWQQHVYDPFLYINGRPPGSLSSRDSCNCRCVTWSLGARNLDTRPICPNRSSVYLTGRKNLPFGAASSLCYETMIHADRRKHVMHPRPPPRIPPKSEESSNENDSLDPSSDADNPSNERRCTCIHPSWAMRTEATNSVYKVRTDKKPNRKKSSGCPHNSASRPESGTMLNGDCPPPVRGSDYLDRTDGVVYWSSNDERLI